MKQPSEQQQQLPAEEHKSLPVVNQKVYLIKQLVSNQEEKQFQLEEFIEMAYKNFESEI